MNKILLAFSFVASATIATPVHALVNIIGQEIGGNVEFSYSGSLDVTGLTSSSNSFVSIINPSFGLLSSFNGGFTNRVFENSLSGPTSFGGGGFQTPSFSSGDQLYIIPESLAVGNNYISGTNISGLVTFNSRTFASLGVTPGVYTYNLTNGLDSVILTIGTTPVPFEFSPALGLGLIGGLVVAKKLSGKLLKK